MCGVADLLPRATSTSAPSCRGAPPASPLRFAWDGSTETQGISHGAPARQTSPRPARGLIARTDVGATTFARRTLTARIVRPSSNGARWRTSTSTSAIQARGKGSVRREKTNVKREPPTTHHASRFKEGGDRTPCSGAAPGRWRPRETGGSIGLSRKEAVGVGERARPACCQRRLAVGSGSHWVPTVKLPGPPGMIPRLPKRLPGLPRRVPGVRNDPRASRNGSGTPGMVSGPPEWCRGLPEWCRGLSEWLRAPRKSFRGTHERFGGTG